MSQQLRTHTADPSQERTLIAKYGTDAQQVVQISRRSKSGTNHSVLETVRGKLSDVFVYIGMKYSFDATIWFDVITISTITERSNSALDVKIKACRDKKRKAEEEARELGIAL